MSIIAYNKRRQELILTAPGEVPTIPDPAAVDPTHPLWISTDIMKGEICINIADNKVWTRTDNGILDITVPITNGAIFPAGATVNGHRVVMVSSGKVIHFDPTTELNLGKTIGISNNAAILDDPVTVLFSGKVTNPGWGLTPDSVYYSVANGQLSVTPPTSGIVLRVGVAVDSNTLNVDFGEPFILI
jgi:hypothetical protein